MDTARRTGAQASLSSSAGRAAEHTWQPESRQAFSGKPSWDGHRGGGGGGEQDIRRQKSRISAQNLDLPPVAVLLRHAVQLPIQRQVRGSAQP
jgi:hypothetical protein